MCSAIMIRPNSSLTLTSKRREVGNLSLWRSFFVGNMDTIMAYPQTLQTTPTMARIARMGHAYTCFFPTIPNKPQPVSLRNALPINSPVSYVFDMFSFFCHSFHIFHICPSSFHHVSYVFHIFQYQSPMFPSYSRHFAMSWSETVATTSPGHAGRSASAAGFIGDTMVNLTIGIHNG